MCFFCFWFTTSKGFAMTLNAIQTSYKGYKFRSRLEARWAVFFDSLDFKWEYEPEGFHLPNGEMYLPDFRVTSPQGMIAWYEVKPEGVTSDAKFDLFKQIITCWHHKPEDGEKDKYAEATILSGDPMSFIELSDDYRSPSFKEGVRACPRCGLIQNQGYGFIDLYGHPSYQCHRCDCTTPCGGGNPSERGAIAWTEPYKGWLFILDDWPYEREYFEAVSHAAKQARSARFEHGQKGAAL
jgi:hypothetical protein